MPRFLNAKALHQEGMYTAYSERQYGMSHCHPAQKQISGLEAVLDSGIAAPYPKEKANSPAWIAYELVVAGSYISAQTAGTASLSYRADAGETAVDEENAMPKTAIYDAPHLMFLKPERPRMPFVAEAGEISQPIKEAFFQTTHRQLPESVTITVAQREALQHLHPQFSNPGIVGLSLNTTKEILVVAGSLDSVMLTIGHEIGHVISPALASHHAEEAKAFAFEMAWAQAIFLNDIAGLRNSINAAALSMTPAQNGLHDLAFAFVKAAALAGKEPMALHSELSEQQTEFGSEHNQQPAYTPLARPSTPAYHSGGYRNKSNVQNVPWLTSFSWADLGPGIYGMYLPLTASIFMNERLLRNNLEQFHKTLGHEYILHHVMQLPDGYIAEIMEKTLFWEKEEEDKYAQ